jgi:hypothetical protein
MAERFSIGRVLEISFTFKPSSDKDIHKFGIQILKRIKYSINLDKINCNNLWEESIKE